MISSVPELLLRREGAVLVVSLNRPDVLNAMTLPMADAYADALRAADADPTIVAIVVTGEGHGFCAGADVSQLEHGAGAIRRFMPRRENLPTLAFRIRKPIVCAVRGPVAGVGFAYMMGSDIRFVAKDAKISTTFARLGLVSEYGLSWLLPRVVGAGWSLDLLLSARTITGAEAVRIGLAQYASTADQVLDDAIHYANRLAESNSPASMAAAKAQVYADLEASSEDALTRALDMMDSAIDGPELDEALAARAEKRPPRFQPLN